MGRLYDEQLENTLWGSLGSEYIHLNDIVDSEAVEGIVPGWVLSNEMVEDIK